MGYQPNRRAWERGAESNAIRGQENTTTPSELVEKYSIQAKNYADKNPNLVSAFVSQNFHTTILDSKNPENAAAAIARNEPHFIPDSVEGLGMHHQTAFLQALAIELAKPEYNQ